MPLKYYGILFTFNAVIINSLPQKSVRIDA